MSAWATRAPNTRRTRHNAGFWWLDAAASKLGATLQPQRSYFGAGRARRPAARHRLAAAADDLHEPVGQVGGGAGALLQDRAGARSSSRTTNSTCCPARSKLKLGGSPAGHNGLKDIHAQLGTPDYWRLRLGIGHPGVKAEVVDYVLRKPPPEQREAIDRRSSAPSTALDLLLAGEHGARDDEDARQTAAAQAAAPRAAERRGGDMNGRRP